MKFPSQRIAHLFFATSMLLVCLQILYGLLMAVAHMGWDGLHEWLPFHVMRSTHTNLLLMWLLSGFMGAAYYLIPEEIDRPVVTPWLGVVQWAAFVIVGVTAVVGFHFSWWEGRKFLEIPRPLDWLVVADMLLFLGILGMTLWKAQRRTATALVLYFGLFSAAIFYLFGMIDTVHPTVDSFWRWWVVHLWVEGVWELIMGAMLAFLLLRLTGVDREVVEKWLYVVVGLTFLCLPRRLLRHRLSARLGRGGRRSLAAMLPRPAGGPRDPTGAARGLSGAGGVGEGASRRPAGAPRTVPGRRRRGGGD